MSYTDENTKIQYISVSGQTAYTVPFTVYQTSDIQVWKNSSELIDLTDYNDVLNVDNEISSITLVVPATTGDVITILRNTEVNRATNFTNNIKISTNSLNTEFNRIYRKLDELGDKQSLKFADYSTASAALILPEPQSNKWLVWNSAQTALVNSTITLSDLGDLSGNLQEDYEEYSAFLSSQTVTHIINLNDEYTELNLALTSTGTFYINEVSAVGQSFIDLFQNSQYAQLSAINTFTNPIISTAPNNLATNSMPITIGENGNRGITGIGTTQLGFIVANDIAATVASAGTTLANTYTIVTREKGDARYQLAGEYVTTSGLNGQIPVATGSNTITYEYINDYISGAVATSSNSINLFPILKSPYAFTITSATVFSAVGTPSIIFRIDNVPITGLNGIGASAGSYNSQNATALNVVSVGSNVSVLVSGAGFSDFRWQISYRRN